MFRKLKFVSLLIFGFVIVFGNGDSDEEGSTSPPMTLKECFEENKYSFRDCYKDVGVKLTRSGFNLTEDEEEDFICTLYNVFYSCWTLKTDLFCGLNLGHDLKKFTTLIAPPMDTTCNKTGIILAKTLRFSI